MTWEEWAALYYPSKTDAEAEERAAKLGTLMFFEPTLAWDCDNQMTVLLAPPDLRALEAKRPKG